MVENSDILFKIFEYVFFVHVAMMSVCDANFEVICIGENATSRVFVCKFAPRLEINMGGGGQQVL